MLALILACTVATPCIYVEPNPTLPKDITHETPSIPIQPTPTRTTTPPLTPPRTTPTPHAGTQRPKSARALPENVPFIPLRETRTYTVQPGDCLYSIGLRYGATWQTLWAHNPGIMDPNLIWPGELVALP